MIPAKRMGMPADTAGAVLFLASQASSYTTGADLIIDGGYSAV
jgi:NAD(P)-dependent dehydrogenase (short-subunit alcohol dehydrogenase family)